MHPCTWQQHSSPQSCQKKTLSSLQSCSQTRATSSRWHRLQSHWKQLSHSSCAGYQPPEKCFMCNTLPKVMNAVADLFFLMAIGVKRLIGSTGRLPKEGRDDVCYNWGQGKQFRNDNLLVRRFGNLPIWNLTLDTRIDMNLTMKIAHLKVIAS